MHQSVDLERDYYCLSLFREVPLNRSWLDLGNLLADHDRIGLANLFLCKLFVVEGAVVLVRVAMQSTVEASATTLEP